MKKSIFMLLLVTILTAIVSIKSVNAQDKKPNWPGVTIKVLTENEHVKIAEVTFAAGAVADWHSHPQHTVYAVTDIKMQIEERGKEASTVDIKKGEAVWMPAVTHKATNVGKASFTGIVTEIKEQPHRH
jgi:beta-alanine degradation protein BauB